MASNVTAIEIGQLLAKTILSKHKQNQNQNNKQNKNSTDLVTLFVRQIKMSKMVLVLLSNCGARFFLARLFRPKKNVRSLFCFLLYNFCKKYLFCKSLLFCRGHYARYPTGYSYSWYHHLARHQTQTSLFKKTKNVKNKKM